MRRIPTLLAVAALLALGLSPVAGASAHPNSRTSPYGSGYQDTLCASEKTLCLDSFDSIGPSGEYTGHDEPSLDFLSNKPGSGYDMTYTLTLPTEPKTVPVQNGTGGTWNFQLRPTFWLGLTLCDSQSAPEFTNKCTPNTDANNLTSSDPNSPSYIGKHPGNAFLELQFYGPGYVPQFEGFGCAATQYCAAMTIDSRTVNQNTGQENTAACNAYFLGGPEPINWAYVTKSGVSQAPANPISTSTDPNLTAVTPDYTKDLLMSPGDQIRVHMYDTAAGFRTDLSDLTTGQSGSMTASTANGFGHIMYTPTSATCHEQSYAFHPEYSTAVARGTTWAAHSDNVAFSDEIGHFEFCNAIDANFNCTQAGANDPGGLDNDDSPCLPAADSTLIKVTSCYGSDNDFDGPSYLNDWPGTLANPNKDQKIHPSPVMFTSPTTGGSDYTSVAF